MPVPVVTQVPKSIVALTPTKAASILANRSKRRPVPDPKARTTQSNRVRPKIRGTRLPNRGGAI